jgi:hypothetical protein
MNRTAKRTLAALGLAVVAACAALAEARAPSIETLEQQFRELPLEARRLTGPLFWLYGDESPERLRMYLEKVVEGGNVRRLATCSGGVSAAGWRSVLRQV